MVDDNQTQKDIDFAQHILSTSLTMVGFCTTLIGLVKVVEAHSGPSHVDEYTALVLLMFLASAILAYNSLRFHDKKLGRSLQRWADKLLMIGLIAISLIASFFAYDFI